MLKVVLFVYYLDKIQKKHNTNKLKRSTDVYRNVRFRTENTEARPGGSLGGGVESIT